MTKKCDDRQTDRQTHGRVLVGLFPLILFLFLHPTSTLSCGQTDDGQKKIIPTCLPCYAGDAINTVQTFWLMSILSTDSKQYLKYNSCQPKYNTINIPLSLARIICTIVSDKKYQNLRLQELWPNENTQLQSLKQEYRTIINHKVDMYIYCNQSIRL